MLAVLTVSTCSHLGPRWTPFKYPSNWTRHTWGHRGHNTTNYNCKPWDCSDSKETCTNGPVFDSLSSLYAPSPTTIQFLDRSSSIPSLGSLVLVVVVDLIVPAVEEKRVSTHSTRYIHHARTEGRETLKDRRSTATGAIRGR